MSNGFFEQVYQLVNEIPTGKVTSYSQIAARLEQPHNARVVGWAMRQAPTHVPAHRVVKKSGELAPGFSEQRSLLEGEGVAFDKKGRVLMHIYNWEL
ncbi:MGMT family protein [Salsuginibacillus kocurii]|uniref:MGMT family protein n=1 Tax=Salsuginibacillus kocurii TaxID=427078 RepID=UPI00036FF782|nr:MGMT family protein [Salsuginibacillus kocurii]